VEERAFMVQSILKIYFTFRSLARAKLRPTNKEFLGSEIIKLMSCAKLRRQAKTNELFPSLLTLH